MIFCQQWFTFPLLHKHQLLWAFIRWLPLINYEAPNCFDFIIGYCTESGENMNASSPHRFINPIGPLGPGADLSHLGSLMGSVIATLSSCPVGIFLYSPLLVALAIRTDLYWTSSISILLFEWASQPNWPVPLFNYDLGIRAWNCIAFPAAELVQCMGSHEN